MLHAEPGAGNKTAAGKEHLRQRKGCLQAVLAILPEPEREPAWLKTQPAPPVRDRIFWTGSSSLLLMTLSAPSSRACAAYGGGNQQGGLRPGTEPVALIVGLAAALQDACEHRAQNAAAKRALAADFCRTLRQGWPAARFHSTADGLPGLVSVGLPGQDSQNMTYRLDLAGVCVSPGAACDNTGRTHPSHVLLALGGQAAEDALCTLRFSFGAANAPGDGAEAARRLLNLLHTD